MKTLMVLSAFCYFLGMVKFFLHFSIQRKSVLYLATMMITIGFLLHTAMLFTISKETGHGPYTNPFEQACFLSWAIMGTLIAAIFIFKMTRLGAFVSPIGFLTLAYGFMLPSGGSATLPVQEFWLTMHLTLSFISLASFAVMFAASSMYIIQERNLKKRLFNGLFNWMPNLDSLDLLIHRSLTFGFPLITVGIASAVVWNLAHTSSLLGNEPARVMPLMLAWGIFATLLGGRLLLSWRGHRIATFGVIGFLISIIALAIHLY